MSEEYEHWPSWLRRVEPSDPCEQGDPCFSSELDEECTRFSSVEWKICFEYLNKLGYDTSDLYVSCPLMSVALNELMRRYRSRANIVGELPLPMNDYDPVHYECSNNFIYKNLIEPTITRDLTLDDLIFEQ